MSYAAKVAHRSSSQQHHRGEPSGANHSRQQFHHPRSSLGATGHWVNLLGVAAPLIVGELVKDPEKRWRMLRIAAVGTALASEVVWTHRLSKDRKKDEEMRNALQSCAEHCI